MITDEAQNYLTDGLIPLEINVVSKIADEAGAAIGKVVGSATVVDNVHDPRRVGSNSVNNNAVITAI